MGKLFVRPAEGLKVRDIERDGYLPPEGAEVTDSPYWRRLLRYKNVTIGPGTPTQADSEVVKADGDADAAAPKPKSKKK